MRLFFLFFAICLGHFYVDAMFGVWPLWKTLAGYNIAEAGVMTGLAVLFGEGMQTYFGKLSDKGFAKKLILIGLILASSSLLYPFTSFPFACFFFFITCLSSASFHPSASHAVAHIPLFSMPIMMTTFQTAGFLGVALGQKIFVSLLAFSQYMPLLLILMPILLAFFLSKKIPVNKEVEQESLSLLKVLSTFWKKPMLKRLYLILVANQAAFWAILFLLPEIMIEKGKSEWLCFGGGTMLFVVGAASTCIPFGLLAARLHIVKLLSFLLTGSALCVSLFVFFTSRLDPYILFALGGTIGAVTPLALALGAQLEPKRRGMISAYLMGGVWILSETIGYMVSSLIYSSITPPKATHTLQLFSLFLFAGLFLSQKMKKHFHTQST